MPVGRGSTSCPSGSGESPSRRGRRPVPQSWPHLRHREPRLHPALPHGAGAVHRPRKAGAGSGLRQRYPLHRRPGPGASAATAVDIDPKAVDVAYENAALNGIGRDRYNVRAGNVLTDGALVAELARQKYALVLANIVADVIIPLSARAGNSWTRTGCSCAPASSTPGPAKWRPLWSGMAWPCLSGGSRTVGWPWPPVRPGSGVQEGVRASLVRTPSLSKGMTRNPPCGFWRTAL